MSQENETELGNLLRKALDQSAFWEINPQLPPRLQRLNSAACMFRAEILKREEKVCEWEINETTRDWDSGCGNSFGRITRQVYGFPCCPFCGGKIKESKP